jgi:hypothetical protein
MPPVEEGVTFFFSVVP